MTMITPMMMQRARPMLEMFFIRALVAGLGLALVAGPLGTIIVWRRMAYFGDTMAHAALLGVALAFLLGIDLTLGVFAIALLVSGALILLQRQQSLSSDALLGILSHSTLAVGLVLIAFMTHIRIDLMGYLFGDILAVSVADLWAIGIGGALVLGLLALVWQPVLAATVSPEIAAAEGQRPELMRVVVMLMMAIVIAIAMKLVGILLITSLLIIPAATARQLARTPEQMALGAALIGMLAAALGLFASLTWNTPSGPSIVVAALVLFLIAYSLALVQRKQGG